MGLLVSTLLASSSSGRPAFALEKEMGSELTPRGHQMSILSAPSPEHEAMSKGSEELSTVTDRS
ncbi:unnamed protein product [Ectocarpus sp. CCAP 1310/34]|nr:unnamed protein product [Ectocarpus sp. CCAP 1310/34]